MKKLILILTLGLISSFGQDSKVTTETKDIVTIQWLPIKSLGGTNGVHEVGFITTNQILFAYHDGKTNAIIIKQIGQEDFPSLTRTNKDSSGPRNRMITH